MAFDAAGNWQAGPNDHHVALVGEPGAERAVIQPGLGADEAQGRAIDRLRNGEKRMEMMQSKLNTEAKALEKQQTAIDKKARELELREMEIAEREKRVAAAESKK